MMELYDSMYERREKLLAQIKEIQRKLLELPEGELHVHKDRTRTKWILYIKDSKGVKRKIHIPKTQPNDAQLHALSTLYQARLKDRQIMLKAVERFLRVFDPACRGLKELLRSNEDVLLENEGFSELLNPYRSAKKLAIEEWKKEDYPKNTDYYSEQLIHQVSPDLFVRSKSELMIAEEYRQSGIPFRYEMRIGEGRGSLLCDFVLLNPKTMETLYHEHFGLMDDPEYARAAASKIEKYAAKGIYLGINLIVPTETAQHPVTRDVIRRTIRHYFDKD